MASFSSSRKRKHDVFLSFRGEDTRPNILSHLRRRLDDERIDTFKDDTEMERGEEIGPSLLEAIESSRIALIVLSKRYADSKWCLDELVEIMKRKDSGELKVIPIFYDVDPSDVLNPTTGIFAKDFDRHEKNSEEKAQLWTTAMAQVANLSGYHLKNCRSEAELLNEVIAGVWKELKPTQSVCTNRFVGINSQIEEVKRLLSLDKPDHILVIGIVGMGGIGKTTIARVTSEQIFREFDGISFLCVEETPRELGRPDGLIGRLLSELLNETVIINRPFIGGFSDAILTRLCRKKVLIVLDDVNNSEQLEDLIGQNGSFVFGPGSRIMVTSRDKQLLRTICSDGDDSIYEARGLYDDDARQLFCQHAFKTNYPKEDFNHMVWQILGYADGNPLALKVLGASLFSKPKSIWESVLNGLNKCQKQGIHKVLRISYDRLDKKLKDIFLHVACLFDDEKTSRVIPLLDSCGLQTRSGLDDLGDKCLLDLSFLQDDLYEDYLLDYADDYWEYVDMHSLLREMGRKIVGEESDDPGKRSRLWDSNDIYQVFNKNSGTEAIEGIKLGWKRKQGKKDVSLKSDAFKKMPYLKFLIFLDEVHCPELEHLPDELRFLQWECCPLERLPINFQPTNLVELSLDCSKLKRLWEGIQDLGKLKKISLQYSECLIELPDLSKAKNLVEIDLLGCSSLVEIPSSMNHLDELKHLKLEYCRNIKSLPSPIAWRSLESLALDGCSELTSFPEIECLDALKILEMPFCKKLESLPSSIWKLKSLEKLYLKGCSNLENLSKRIESPESSRSQLHKKGQISPLKCLNISDCEKIRLLPELSGTLLEFLDLSDCESLETAAFDLEQPCRFQFESFDTSMLFCNCRKLDLSRSKIAALAKMKIQAEATYSYFQGTYKDYMFNMVYPGCEIPKWIKHQNMGHFITIHLPVNKRFLGFAVCFVVSAGYDDFGWDFCFGNTSGDSFSWSQRPELDFVLESEHVILSYAFFKSREYNEMVEKLGCRGDCYEVTFNVRKANVLKCGMVPLYVQNVNYNGFEAPPESETTEVTINLTEDKLNVFVNGYQVKYPDQTTVLRTYKDANAEIFEVDPLTLPAFGGTLYCVWGNKRCQESEALAFYRQQLEYLPTMVARVWSDDSALKLGATAQFRKLLSIERRPPIEEVIEAGVVPRFVEFLMREDFPQLQFKAAWALTNIASGTSENTKVVIDHGAVPIFVKLLGSPSDDVREQAVWALGNVAGDSPRCRDLVLGQGALIPLLAQLNEHAKLSMLRVATWALSKFCQGEPQPPFSQVKPALPALARLILSNDEEVLTDACWALSYLSDGTNDKIQAVIEAGVCPRLVELLLHPSPSVLIPALRTVGNIVTGDDMQTQCIINHQALPYLLNLLTNNSKKSIKKAACRTISNITASNKEQIQAVIEANIIGPLVHLLQNAELDIKKGAAWAISNGTSGGTHEQMKYLVRQGCIKPLCDLLVCPDPGIVTVCLEGLENILKAGEAEKNAGNTGVVSLYAKMIDEAEGLDKIENLRSHENTQIYEKAVKILETYRFEEEDETLPCQMGSSSQFQANPTDKEIFQGIDFRVQPNPEQAFNQQQKVDLCTELQLRLLV